MTRKKIFKATLLILIAGLLLFASPALAEGIPIPPMPHAFFGNLLIDGSPAPINTKVEVSGIGVETGVKDNPILTTEVGKYGKEGPFTKLLAKGDSIADGTTLTFYVDDVSTGITYPWHEDTITRLDLSIITPPEDGGPVVTGGGGGPRRNRLSQARLDLD